MMQQEDLLRDVLAHAHLDEPRLRYADWLDGRRDPFGEFIRTQLELAALPAGDARLLELERRERALLAEFEMDWIGDLAERVDWWVFRRGFVTEVALTMEEFLEGGSELFARHPIQAVHLDGPAERLAAVARCPQLARPRYLDLSGNRLGDAAVRVLAGSEQVRNLRGLNLSCTWLGDAAARALAQSPHLDDLHALYLSSNRIGDVGGRAIAASPRLNHLERLFLDCNAIGHSSEKLLARRFGSRVHLR